MSGPASAAESNDALKYVRPKAPGSDKPGKILDIAILMMSGHRGARTTLVL